MNHKTISKTAKNETELRQWLEKTFPNCSFNIVASRPSMVLKSKKVFTVEVTKQKQDKLEAFFGED